MKIIFTFICFIFSILSYSQKKAPDTAFISVSCGFGGYNSQEFLTYSKLIKAKDYTTIGIKLIQGELIENVLSSIVLSELFFKRKIDLTQEELDKIKELKNSKMRYELCYTCTVHMKGTLKEFFSDKNNFSAYKIVKSKIFSGQ